MWRHHSTQNEINKNQTEPPLTHPATPPPLTWSFASVSAPAAKSAPAIALWPLSAANISGVFPSCARGSPSANPPLPRGWYPDGVSIAHPSQTTPQPLSPPTPPPNPPPYTQSFESLQGLTDTKLRFFSGSGFLRSAFALKVHRLRIKSPSFTKLQNRPQSVWGRGCRISECEASGLRGSMVAGVGVLRSRVGILRGSGSRE